MRKIIGHLGEEQKMKKKQLDNSNPSKVLECLEKVKGYRTGGLNSPEVYLEETKEYNTIKQYILRTQKQNLKSIYACCSLVKTFHYFI